MKILMLVAMLLMGLSAVAKADCVVMVSSDGSSESVECTDGGGSFDFTLGG